jgi:hypothetical protein
MDSLEECNATYTERSTQVALNCSIVTLVLLGSAPGDCEFIPVRPRLADNSFRAEMRARWPGRGLRTVGTIGLCLSGGVSVRCALKEPLDPAQVEQLGTAFTEYLWTLLRDGLAEQEASELLRLWALPDTRPGD